MTGEELIKRCDLRGDFLMGEDGYWVWWPEEGILGFLESWALRVIADELDKRNEDWDKKIQEDLENNT